MRKSISRLLRTVEAASSAYPTRNVGHSEGGSDWESVLEDEEESDEGGEAVAAGKGLPKTQSICLKAEAAGVVAHVLHRNL